LLALCFLVSACAGKKDDKAVSVEETENAVEFIAVDDQKSEETKDEDKPIVIGGFNIQQTVSDQEIFIIISEDRSADLSGIEQIPVITDLSLSMNKDAREVDLEPLGRLPHLYSVDLGGWGVTVIPDFSSSTNLTRLILDRTSLTSLDGIENLTALEFLQISGNRVPLTDMSALRYLTNLRSLHIYAGSYNIDFSDISDLPRLTELNLQDIGEINLLDVAELTSLEKLSLYSDEVSFPSLDVSPLSRLTNLQELTIIGFEIENIESLDVLPNLDYIVTRRSTEK
jgi:Leucine-rich repeat (LRR) protein